MARPSPHPLRENGLAVWAVLLAKMTSTTRGDKEMKKTLLVEKLPVKPPGKPRFKMKTNNQSDSRLNREETDGMTEEEYCTKLLIDGYVQSFVDFYHLTQRVDPNNTDGSNRKIQCSNDEMAFIRNNLVLAEISRRQGNIIGVYTAYNKLASSYKKKKDWKTAIFFQEKCLEVAQLTTDLKAEMLANHTLGIIYQAMNLYDAAKVYHEKHEEIAKSIDHSEEIVTANMELQKVYLVLAERLEEQKCYHEALKMYELCLSSSIKCMDLPSQGEVYGKIGALLLHHGRGIREGGDGGLGFELNDTNPISLDGSHGIGIIMPGTMSHAVSTGKKLNPGSGDPSAALHYLQQYSQISSDIGDTISRCKALSLLSLAYDQLGESTKALTELSLVHTIAEQTGDIFLQSKACYSLGTLYSKLRYDDQSKNILQRYFDLLKAITSSASAGSQHSGPGRGEKPAGGGSGEVNLGHQSTEPQVGIRDLELARVYVGISRGNVMIEEYMSSIGLAGNLGDSQDGMTRLLDWKLNRAEITKGTQVTSEKEK
jgi:tetratricopeptide (TPR) repeat protein